MDKTTLFYLLGAKELNKIENHDLNSYNINSNNIKSNSENTIIQNELLKKINELDSRINNINKEGKKIDFIENENSQIENILIQKVAKLETNLSNIERMLLSKKTIPIELTKNLEENQDLEIKEFNDLNERIEKIKKEFSINKTESIKREKQTPKKNERKKINNSQKNKKESKKINSKLTKNKIINKQENYEEVIELKNKLDILIGSYEKLKDKYPKEILNDLQSKIIKVENQIYDKLNKKL